MWQWKVFQIVFVTMIFTEGFELSKRHCRIIAASNKVVVFKVIVSIGLAHQHDNGQQVFVVAPPHGIVAEDMQMLSAIEVGELFFAALSKYSMSFSSIGMSR